ncbi:hypothetical protein HYS28_00435 [Candidatus Uhrbacteria bacterium]|nr:hypothetical protein [Candidatus Uhrbacteria bacterium]
MRFVARWFRQVEPASAPPRPRGVPYEVVGRGEDGRRIYEIVWATGFWEARTVVAEMYGLTSRILVRAYELTLTAEGIIAYAANGKPIRKFE